VRIVYESQVSCTFDYLTRTPSNIVYNYCLVVFQFVLPMLIIVGCYVSIVRAAARCVEIVKNERLQQLATSVRCQERERKQEEQEVMSYEYRLAKVRDNRLALRTRQT